MEQPKMFYQKQKNGTLHLVEVKETGGLTYRKYIPHLPLPIIESKALQKRKLKFKQTELLDS